MKNRPTLLEIACHSNHWSEYLDVDGQLEQHELAVTDPVGRLMQMQECGFTEAYIGDMYSSTGELLAEGVIVEVESAAGNGWHVPTIIVGNTAHRTQDFLEITSDTITGPGGWYVVGRSDCFSVAWSKGENGETVASDMTREEAIAWADAAFADWGNSGHPDYSGVSWVVSDDCEVIYSTPACK